MSSSPSSSITIRPALPNLDPTFISPDGLVINEASAELLAELPESIRRRHPASEDEEFGQEDDDGADADADFRERMNHAQGLPWWRRPSVWWQFALLPFPTIAMTATMAPGVALYTQLACKVHRPDIFGLTGLSEGAPEACAEDPVVQASVAALSAVIVTMTGILCCFTTSWWSSLSDRYGRLPIQSLSTFGQVFTDLNRIFVAYHIIGPGTWGSKLPGGYWFLIVGSLVEGSVGGLTTVQAVSTGYLCDLTGEADRSRILSLSLGLTFTGLALGPVIGSLLIRHTQSIISVFYASVALQAASLAFLAFVIPESLLKSQMERAKERWRYERMLKPDDGPNGDEIVIRAFKKLKTTVKGVLSPLSVFLLEDKSRGKRDWNLVLLISSYGIALTVMGSYTYKFQFAQATFKWGPEEIGYWLSIIGISRGIYMTLILPFAIKVLKPKPYVIEIPPTEPPTPLNPTSSSETSPLLPSREPPTPIHKDLHTPSFDLSLCRISLFAELVGYTILALSAEPIVFAIAGIFGAFGSGYSPALQSVGLGMYLRNGGKESGRLFGALGLVQSLCTQIIGPSLYGVIYSSTVSTHPRTIFYVSVLTILLAFLCLALVRVPKVGEEPGDRLRRHYQDDEDSRSILIEDRRTAA